MEKNILNEMRKFEDELSRFHIPRVEDMPDIELYMDQVVALLNKNLYIIANNDNVITPSMVNNYVKFGLIPAPKGKRYTRKHLCYMTVLCFLKQILSMNEINLLVKEQLKHSSELETYNLFCDELEKAFKKFTTFESTRPECEEKNYCLVYCAKAIAYKLHAQKFVQTINPFPLITKKMEDETKKKEEKSEKKNEKKSNNSKKQV